MRLQAGPGRERYDEFSDRSFPPRTEIVVIFCTMDNGTVHVFQLFMRKWFSFVCVCVCGKAVCVGRIMELSTWAFRLNGKFNAISQ